MMRRVALHEWRILARGRASRTVVVIALAMTALVLVIGSARARADARDRAALSEWAGQQHSALARAAATDRPEVPEALVWGPRSAEFVANERGTYVVAPPPPLAALTVGYGDLYPNHYRITARLREAQLGGDQLEHPLVMLVGHLDLAFVVVYLLPLWILVLMFDLTAEERRSGTLWLVLARPIRLRTVVLGKLAARSSIIMALVGLVAIGALAASDWSGSTLARLALWIGAVLAYAFVWLALSVLIDARGRSAANNAVVLASTWLMALVVIPAVVNLSNEVVHPYPSRIQLATAVRAATHAAAAESSRLLGRFLEDHPSSGVGRAGMQQYAALQEAREVEVTRRLQPTLSRFESRLEDRRALVSRLQYLSPAMLVQAALVEITGTGAHRQRAFRDQAMRFQRDWKTFFGDRLLSAQPLSPGDYASMPSFAFREERVEDIANRVAVPLAALVFGGALMLWRALARYERASRG